MKVLFLNSKKFDYGQDLLFSGLSGILGPAIVREWPINSAYHLPFRPYPKNLGYVGVRGLVRSHGVPLKQVDLVVLGSSKPDVFRHYIRIARDIPLKTPVVFYDGGDRPEIGGDLIRLGAPELLSKAQAIRPFDLIFKREYLKGETYDKNIRPLPFSMNPRALGVGPQKERNKDVCFWAMDSHPVRSQAFEILKGQFDCDSNGTGRFDSLHAYRYKGRRYHLELAKSRIAISLRGGGWDTLRYWEIPALGTLMLTTSLEIVIPHPFEDQKHIVQCRSDLSDMIELCAYYLKHDSQREQISHQGHQHFLKYHTHTARAADFLVEIEKCL